MYSLGEAMLLSLLLGAFFGLLYTGFRIFLLLFSASAPVLTLGQKKELVFPLIGAVPLSRKSTGTGRVLYSVFCFLFDLLFMFTVGVLLSIFIYSVGGIFRFSYLLLSLVGCVLFSLTLGRVLYSFAGWILFFTRVGFRYLFYFWALPLRFLCRAMRLFFSKTVLLFHRVCDTIRIRSYRHAFKRKRKRERELRERAIKTIALQKLFP